MTTYTRIRYCPECALKFRPHLADWYLNMNGNDRQFLQVQTIVHKDEFGMVPHQIELVNQVGINIVYRAVCAMDGCGIEMIRDKEGKLKLFDKAGNVVVLYQGQFCIEEGGKYYPLPDYEDVFYRSRRIRNPKVQMCSREDWSALLKYDETL